MTRVNLVRPEDLADQHLFAEWRELKMVPAALRRSLKTKSIDDVLKSVPERYTLNAGHVLFFYNKMRFLHNRYVALTRELVENRYYDLQPHYANEIFYHGIPTEFIITDWQPVVADITINVERIMLRLGEKPEWYKYYGKTTSPDYFKALYDLHVAQFV